MRDGSREEGYSLKIARVRGVDFRIHFLFLLFAGVWWFQARGAQEPSAARPPWAVPVALLVMSLVHEGARAWMAGRQGAQVLSTALWPLGGFRREEGVANPVAEFRMTLAGMAGTLMAVGLVEGAFRLGERFGSPAPPAWRDAFLGAGVALLAWNLFPAFPLDGARLLRPLLWARGGYLLGTRALCGISFLSAIFLAIWGFHVAFQGEFYPLALSVVLIGQSYVEARRTLEDSEEWEEAGWEPGGGVAWREGGPSPEPSIPSAPREGWVGAARRRLKERRRARFHQRVDGLLLKVSRSGMEGLSPRERRFLWKASERYRHEA